MNILFTAVLITGFIFIMFLLGEIVDILSRVECPECGSSHLKQTKWDDQTYKCEECEWEGRI